MESDRDRLFTLMMSEKEHADAQIRSYMDLQSKSTGIVFVALTAATGWIFANRDTPLSPRDRGLALIIILLIAAFSIIYGAFTYCAALGYMWYKDCRLNPAFKDLVGQEPPHAVAGFSQSPANLAVQRLARWFNLLLMAGCVALAAVVLSLARDAKELLWWVGASAPVLALAGFALWETNRAIRQTFHAREGNEGPPVPADEEPRSSGS